MKLIFCDMDGSLLNHHSKISPRTLETLIKLEEKGIGIILSSGRHINSLKKFGDMLQFEKYPMSGYSCNNGQAYHDHLGENVLEHERLNYNDYLKVRNYAKTHHYGFIVYINNKRVMFHYNESLLVRLLHLHKPIQEDAIFDKFVFYGRPSFDTEGLDYTCSLVDPYWLEIGPKGVNKGSMLEKIADYHHIDLKDVIAFGNGENDLPMLIKAGTGVAMGNAFKHVKEYSNTVCDDCNHDGIGKYLEDLLL